MRNVLMVGALAMLLVGMWAMPAEGGWGGGRCGASSVRTRVTWEEVKLPTSTEPGYGQRTLPPNELVSSLGGDAKPVLVWFYSLEDERENQTLEASVFTNEEVALSLRKFRTVKIDVESIDDQDLRREYRETPYFLVVDPLKQTLGDIAGKRSVSVSRFKGFVGQTWARLFEMRQRDFVKAMTKILDRLDKLSGQQTVLQAKKARLEERPNPRKSRDIAQEEEELKAEQESIEKDEQAIHAECKLKEEYLKPQEAAEK